MYTACRDERTPQNRMRGGGQPDCVLVYRWVRLVFFLQFKRFLASSLVFSPAMTLLLSLGSLFGSAVFDCSLTGAGALILRH